jgi:hypothetical protein
MKMKTIATILIILILGGCVYFVGFYRPRYESERPLSVREASTHIQYQFPPSAHSIMLLKQSTGPGHFRNLVAFQGDAGDVSQWLAAVTNAKSEKWTVSPFDPAHCVQKNDTPNWFSVTNLGSATTFRNDRTPIRTLWVNSKSTRVLSEEAD